MNHTTNINRRQLMQRLAALTLGTAVAPAFSFATNHFEDPKPIYIASGEGKKGQVGDMAITFKLNKQQTGGHMGLWETTIQPGELGAPPHLHTTYDEICRVVEGSIFIMTGEEVREVKAGDWHLRPKGIVHTFWNSSDKPAKTIDICVPGGHEDYLQELAALFENNNRPKPEDFKMLAEKHDIQYRFDLLAGIMKKYKVKL
jgi:mannose-6-phosphate isomerase-like protein (cupin superfamily)